MASDTPFTDLVNDAARELTGAGHFRAAELIKRLTAQDVEREQESAQRRAAVQTSLQSQLDTINAARAQEGEEPLTMTQFLAGGD